MTEQPPDWALSVPPTDAVHARQTGTEWTRPFTQQQLLEIGGQLVEQFLAKVVQAVVGVFIPGDRGAAFEQLRQWAQGVPILSDIVEAITGVVNGDLSDLSEWARKIPILSDLVELITGQEDGDENDLGTFFLNIRKFLANVNFLDPNFNLLAAANQFLSSILSPAGALTSLTDLPAHLFGNLAPGASDNVAPPFNADTIDGMGLWSWNATQGAIETVGDGTLRQLLGVPFQVAPGQKLTAGVSAQWQSVTASGPALGVFINVYDINDDFIATVPGQTMQDGSSPNLVTNPAANSSGFQALSNQFDIPAGARFARMLFEVKPSVAAGTVRFKAPVLQLPKRIDAGLLGNVENIDQLLATSIEGFQGLENLLTTLTRTFDGLGSAFKLDPLSGVTPPLLFGLAQQTAQNAQLAIDNAIQALQTLGIRTNKPANIGLDKTSEATFHLSDLPHSASTPTTPVAAGTSIIGVLRVAESAVKGSLEFLANGSGLTNVVCNIYRVTDESTGAKTLLWNSPNIYSQVPTGATAGWVIVTIPDGQQPSVDASDLIHLEIVNAGAGTLNVGFKQSAVPNHPVAYPPSCAATRSIAGTGGISPATLNDSQITYGPNIPYINFSINAVPFEYHAPEQKRFANTSSSSAGGDDVWTPPPWLQPGMLVDLVGIGGGHSGQGEYGTPWAADAGEPGKWRGRTVVYGSDIPVNSQVLIHFGAGGPSVNGYFQPGNPGEDTVFRLPDGTELLRCPGGTGTTASGSSGAGDFTFAGRPYYGGGVVAANFDGAPPGGGGGGAVPFSITSGAGGRGEAFVTARQQ